ncbi:hypothetical protein BDV29DRAFT_34980 [Aspergillus leporis]|uniref:Uncharacterized protein n=1 Tax=Aspergillus leporis TaxID=41062 RepID=A0A5N5WPU4_9EURO|nr:hypothetical protein BDV29DRAFT_34980 [Aspergillus leporis]
MCPFWYLDLHPLWCICFTFLMRCLFPLFLSCFLFPFCVYSVCSDTFEIHVVNS